MYIEKLILVIKFIVIVIIVIGSYSCFAQSQNTDSLLSLQEVVIVGQNIKDSTQIITSKRMEVFNRLDVGTALNVLPGITQSNIGARNESTIFVRGFDLRQVPVFIDGVPVYVPYDGYVDLARFTTFDLAEINVSKGYSSILYGPNTLGGAINLISRKPKDKLEFSGATGYLTGGYRSNLNISSNLGKFYFQAGISKLKRDYFNLSQSFNTLISEDGGRRDNSYNNDTKFNIKVGFTPSKNQEYVINYINQQGEKGTPVYAGGDTRNSLFSRPRYWQWPYWNKESLYFLSNITIDSNNYFRFRIFYDKFKNLLESFDDANYDSKTKPYAFESYYNDDTYGGSIEHGSKFIKRNELKFAAHYKRDRHLENNANEPARQFEDNTISFGIENIYKPIRGLKIIPGVSYNVRNSLSAQDYNTSTKLISDFPSNNNDAFNFQLASFYDFNANRIIGVSASKKSRFATVKDRYSYRLGTAIPNPDLHAESAMNYELSYSDLLIRKARFKSSLFYSKISDVIQNVNNVQSGRSQLQNTGVAEFYGLEASLDVTILDKLISGINYTYLERHNLTNSEIKFTDVPNNKIFGYLQYNPFINSYLVASAEYNTNRYSTSYGAQAGGFTLINTKASFKIWKYIAVEGGINNIFDRNYSLAEGYPEQEEIIL